MTQKFNSQVYTPPKKITAQLHKKIMQKLVYESPSTDEWINKKWYIHTMDYY